MTTTEATLGQPLDLPAALRPELVSSSWLPLTAGDAERAGEARTPEHGRPARVFMFFSNFTALACAVGAVGAAVGVLFGLVNGDVMMAGLSAAAAVGLGVFGLIQHTLARHLEHFSRWGWWGAMAELGIGIATNAGFLFGIGSGGLVAIIVNLLFMRYFWRRRADFDVDLGL